MRLDSLTLERYKAYAGPLTVAIRPVTVLVGRNNAGKSALARAVALLASGLSSRAEEPLPLEAKGLRHASSIRDLITNRSTHGNLTLGAKWKDGQSAVELAVTVQAFSSGPAVDPLQLVTSWNVGHDRERVELQGVIPLDPERPEFEMTTIDGVSGPSLISWEGLWPSSNQLELPRWLRDAREKLQRWAAGVRYLRAPRKLDVALFRPSSKPFPHDAGGAHVPNQLVNDDELMAEVSEWFEKVFDVGLEATRSGESASLRLRRRGGFVDLAQAGQGSSQILPVVALAMTAASAPGVDLVEHPAMDLHPAAHGDVADILLTGRNAGARPLIVETHSEMFLLRLRRRVAEGALSPDDVAIYSVDQADDLARLHEVTVRADGSVENWPEGVFYEDYEEVLAIRRAGRRAGLA